VIEPENNIFIAGASGLIGQACEKILRERDYNNILTPSRNDLNLISPTEVKSFFNANNIDVVILAAGKVGGILENKNYPLDFLTTNLSIQLNVATSAIENDCKKVVLFGSSCMYPKKCHQPMREQDLFTGELESTSAAYAVSKMAGLQLGFSFNQQYSSDKFLCVIPNSAYGPGDNFNPESGHVLSSLINHFHQAKERELDDVTLWGSGTPRREFVYSEDIADAVVFLLEKKVHTSDRPINIGSGVDYSISELAEMIKSIIKFQGQINWDTNKPDGAPQKLLDCSSMKSLGWTADTKLFKGLKETYQWFLENIAHKQ